MTIYHVYDVEKGFWYPQPFAVRTTAEEWALKIYMFEELFEVSGFRLR